GGHGAGLCRRHAGRVLDHPTHRYAVRGDQMTPSRQHCIRLGVRPMGALGWLVLLAWPLTALAHTKGGQALGFSSGVQHPLSGLDHVLAMMAVGVWGAQLGPPAVWLLPVTFPMVMACGGMLALMGVPLPGIESGIAMSAIALGSMVCREARPPVWMAT